MKKWLSDLRDNASIIIVTAIITGFISAIGGYVTATINVHTTLATLQEKLVHTVDDIEELQIELSNLKTIQSDLSELSQRYKHLKDKVEISETTTIAMQAVVLDLRQKTINELIDLLVRHGRVDLVSRIPSKQAPDNSPSSGFGTAKGNHR